MLYIRPVIREAWDGNEWQAHCCSLLSLAYREEIQMIPDRIRGDHGLEAYRLDDGIVYQCYAPESSPSIAAQTELQKTKIRTDIGKLVKNENELMKLLGTNYQIRRWVLLTPEYDDKELLKYARTKSDRTRKTPPIPRWCHDTFEIVIKKDTELFPSQLSILYSTTPQMPINVDSAAKADLPERVELAVWKRLEEKLSVHPSLAADPDYLEDTVQALLLDYVRGEDHLQQIEQRYPFAYTKIRQRADLTLSMLQRRLMVGSVDGATEEALTENLARALQQDQPQLEPIVCAVLARHYFSSWWINCPMRYRKIA
ncbi:hypothetical protein MMUR_28350 [Mycolicibacterium murale]|uniref:Uncharacterized protein n=2 Tax=Mycolicibacterium murale TaxID=182220 RepID=A0A7I9WM84_9MYCO|nr:hypothetical protein MMUR_28350 [Mycolicibacterium murale]